MLTNLKLLLKLGYLRFLFFMDGGIKHFYMRRGHWMDTDYLHQTILKLNEAIAELPMLSFAYKSVLEFSHRVHVRIAEFEEHNYKLAEREG